MARDLACWYRRLIYIVTVTFLPRITEPAKVVSCHHQDVARTGLKSKLEFHFQLSIHLNRWIYKTRSICFSILVEHIWRSRGSYSPMGLP